MAYLNTTTKHGTSHAAQAAFFMNEIATRYKRYRIYRQTFNELSELSTRELNDLGFSRSELRYLARKAAQEAQV